MGNFGLVLRIKDLLIKQLENVNAEQSNFLANKTARLVLGLYVSDNIIQNNSPPKLQNFSLFFENHVPKLNWSLWRHKIPKRWQLFWKNEDISKRKRFWWTDLIWCQSYFFHNFFSKASFADPFQKRLNSILSIYLPLFRAMY